MARKRKGLQFYKKKKKISKTAVREIFEFLILIGIAVFIAFAIDYAVGVSVATVGNSMEPMLCSGERVLINRYSYLLASPRRNDVVAFLPNGNENTHYYIKRVVAVPGDTVQIKNGYLFVNDEIVDSDDYERMTDAGIAINPIELKSGEYFVLGDNRNSSEDSRFADIGAVEKNYILGRVWFHLGLKDEKESHRAGFVK